MIDSKATGQCGPIHIVICNLIYKEFREKIRMNVKVISRFFAV